MGEMTMRVRRVTPRKLSGVNGEWGGRDTAQCRRLPQLPILASLVLDSRQRYDGQGADGGVTLILVGNEKGGSGKSTVAVHLALAFLALGRRVATVDLDSRQQTMTRFFSNRAMFAERHRLPLALPDHRLAVTSKADSVREAQAEEIAWLSESLTGLAADNDIVIIDGLGSDSSLSRFAHAGADILLTPVNDSLVDLDVLADLDPESLEIRAPSRYGDMVCKQREVRAKSGAAPARWIVLRNRRAHIRSANQSRIEETLDRLAPRLGFTALPGLAERMIYRELFLHGLSVLDSETTGFQRIPSHRAALAEVRALTRSVVAMKREPAVAVAAAV